MWPRLWQQFLTTNVGGLPVHRRRELAGEASPVSGPALWGKRLGKPANFTPVHPCSKNTGVMDEHGLPVPTPHNFFVDDDCIVEVYIRMRIKQAVAASIEAIFRLLGKPDITKRQDQDPVSWDKLLEMLVNYANILLGHHINTRKMIVSVPHDYLNTLNNHHAAEMLRWLKHLMGHLYTSLAAALGASNQHLLLTSKTF
jgi:hypothetical protein